MKERGLFDELPESPQFKPGDKLYQVRIELSGICTVRCWDIVKNLLKDPSSAIRIEFWFKTVERVVELSEIISEKDFPPEKAAFKFFATEEEAQKIADILNLERYKKMAKSKKVLISDGELVEVKDVDDFLFDNFTGKEVIEAFGENHLLMCMDFNRVGEFVSDRSDLEDVLDHFRLEDIEKYVEERKSNK
jgi:hypothetical protein